MTSSFDSLAEVRRSLLVEFAALPGEGDVLAWQRRLADAIIAAEAKDTAFDADELKRHRHLLRVIGDALVHTLLPSHTIRALSRHPGKPAALTAQGADFDYVFEVAERVRGAGAVPIIADLTTLIGVGDIVGWGAGGIGVIECKNREMPDRVSTSGRVAPQRERGERVEQYLRASSAVEDGDLLRVAYAAEVPEPRWAVVPDLLERCVASPDRLATSSLGPDDTLVASLTTPGWTGYRNTSRLENSLPFRRWRRSQRSSTTLTIVAGHRRATRCPERCGGSCLRARCA